VNETLAIDVLNSLTAQIAVLDSRGFIVEVNEAWKRFARENNSADQACYVGASYLAACEAAIRRGGDGTAETAFHGIRAVLRGEQHSFSLEYPCHSPDEERWFVVRMTRFSHGATINVVVAHENITARKRAEEQLRLAKEAIEAVNRELQQALAREQIMARTDELTGLNNRRHFLDLAAREFAVAQRYRNPLSIILFDIDHFKRVNDAFGHQAGDAILKSVAQVARVRLRDADVLARYGGEEFIVMLPNTNAQAAAVVAEYIREGIPGHGINIDKDYVSVTISAGVVEISPRGDTLDRLIRRADQALYAAKTAGRNRTMGYSPGP